MTALYVALLVDVCVIVACLLRGECPTRREAKRAAYRATHRHPDARVGGWRS